MSRRDIARRTRTDQRVLSHDGRDIPIRTQRNRQARHMTLRIDAKDGCAVLTLPTYVAIREGMDFAKSKADWLACRLDELAPHTPFADDATIPYHGQDILVRHFPLAGPDPMLVGDVLYVPGSPAMVPGTVREWLMEEARRALPSGSRSRPP